jgi:hypothetical protein
MLIPIQTFSDIITNSSSEVYISERNEKLIKTLEANGIYYYDFTDESVLRDFVENQFYELYDVVKYNPYADYELRDGFREHYTEDQMWEILKPFYKQLLNKVYINIDRDYLFNLEVNKGINFTKLLK